jgi:hypothetical protein
VRRWLAFFALTVSMTTSLGIDDCNSDEMIWFAEAIREEFNRTPALTEHADPEVRAAGEAVEAIEKEKETAELEVRGTKEFQSWTFEALDMLRAQAPEAYQQVTGSIRIVDPVEAGSGMYVDEGRFQVGRTTAYAPGYDRDQQLVWYAGTLVHDACHAALHKQGKVWHGREGEVACLREQKAALRKLSNAGEFVDHVQSLIDGADDSSSQYWNQPHRHW